MVLYQKYRPKKFNEVVGQKHIVKALQAALDHPAHAYLFTGSRGVGKTTIARIFAKAINCEQRKQGEACMECPQCLSANLDLIEINAADNRRIEDVRTINENIKYAPTTGKYKVYLIDEVHMFTTEAFNALLKTLEEPPAHAVFILATTDVHKVPATILSRVQRFDFHSISHVDIVELLEKISQQEQFEISSEVLGLIATEAAGGMRDALSILEKISTLGTSPSVEESRQLLGIISVTQVQNLIDMIFSGDGSGIVTFFNALSTSPISYKTLNTHILQYLKDRMIDSVQDGRAQLADLLYVSRLFLRASKELIDSSLFGDLPLVMAALEASQKFSSQPKANAPKAVEPSVPPQVTPVATSNSSISLHLADVQEKWPDVVAKIRVVNNALASQLLSSELLSVQGNILEVKVKYLFHKETLESSKNFQLITNHLSEIFGGPVSIRCVVAKKEEAGDSLSAALKIFGGEIIQN